MPEENMEETLETTPDVEESKETTEESPVPKPKEQDLESLNKQLYMRVKKAEEKAKELERKLESTPKYSPDSIDAILEVQQATQGLDSTEISELKLRANATGKSLLESRKDENYSLWQEARRAKVEKEKALEPSSRQEATKAKDAAPGPDASLQEIGDYYRKMGILKPHGNPPPPQFTPRM